MILITKLIKIAFSRHQKIFFCKKININFFTVQVLHNKKFLCKYGKVNKEMANFAL